MTQEQMNSWEKSDMDKKAFIDFADAINDHHVDGLYSLMTGDHKYVDAHGNEVPFFLCFHYSTTEDPTIKFANAVPVFPRNNYRGMVSNNYVCHD